MISRKDNLLIRPWEQRRYENHRKKVLSAGPAIDNREPATRSHLLIKLKKHQKEKERHAKIERDNFSLLRNLAYIMRTNRVDNSWSTPQPNFLNRITLFESRSKYKDTAGGIPVKEKAVGRKAKCCACTPQRIDKPEIPEERIPWEPEKLPLSLKIRSQSVPLIKKTPEIPQERTKSCTENVKRRKPEKSKGKLILPQCLSPTSVTFQRGSLKLAVNFPTDTTVKLEKEKTSKILLGGKCYCRNTR